MYKHVQKFLFFLPSVVLLYSCNQNEYAPEIADQEFEISENSANGSVVGVLEAFDADDGQVISYKIEEGNEDGVFSLDGSSGIITIQDDSKLDYETVQEYRISVVVCDNHEKEPMESSALILINILDINESAPVIEAQTFTIPENYLNGRHIGTIEASDGDIYQQLSFEILSGNDAGYFDLDALSGELTVSDSSGLDFEKNQLFELLVQVSDDQEPALSSVETVSVSLTDVLEITDGLIAYFPFDGDAEDWSGNRIQTELKGPSLTSDRYGNIESAYSFDGVDDYIKLNQNLPIITGSEFTISMWVKIYGPNPGLSGNAFFEQRYDQSPDPVVIYFRGDYNGNVLLHMRSTGSPDIEEVKPEYVTDSEWHHYSASLDTDGTMRVYIDGVLLGSHVFPHGGDFVTNVNQVSLGAHHPDGSLLAGLYGEMDDVYIHGRALEPNEIENLSSR